MTRNQEKATSIAEAILTGRIPADELPDDEWSLLLLAAGENSPSAPAETVSGRVLEQAVHHSGYFFTGVTRGRSSSTLDAEDPTVEWFI